MTSIIHWCVENTAGILAVIGGVVTLATAIVKLTPSAKDDTFLAQVVQILSALSLCNADGSFIGSKK